MKSREGEGKLVCVTGASGYIASWVVKLLLLRGYTVNATVRDPGDPRKTEHLLALDGAKERLHFFKADLIDEGSFEAAMDGCVGVFHTASPVSFSPTVDPQADLIDPAVKGTLNVLKACKKVGCIKRVIITSSLATVPFSGKPLTADVIVDETWYSDPDVCRDFKVWYLLAKTLSERAAWDFVKDNPTDLVTLHPGFVIGPLLQPTLNFSVEMILNLVNGAETYPDNYYMHVDVRDVADAHIKAFETTAAQGRYCLVTDTTHFSEILTIIHRLYPTLNLPQKGEDLMPFLFISKISKDKAKALGVNFTPFEVSLKDTIESLQEKGFLVLK